MQRRGEKRVSIRLPVKIWGTDANSKPFQLNVHTLDITPTGVRLGEVQCQLKAGDVIFLQYENEKARYKVMWVGVPGTAANGQVGLFCKEKKRIWGGALSQLKQPVDWHVPGRDRPAHAVPPTPACTVSAEEITKRLQAAIADLKELEKLIAVGAVEPRILAEFREATNHVRQTAWVVEQWLEMVEYKKDAYTTLNLMTAERIRCLTQLSQELIRDVEGGYVTYETENIVSLADVVIALSQRLAKMVKVGIEEGEG